MLSSITTYLTVYALLIGIGMAVFRIMLMLSVKYSVRANSIEGGGIYTVMTMCGGVVPAIVYACVKQKLSTAPIDTTEKLADKKRSTTCLVLGIVLSIVLVIAGLAVYIGGAFSTLMAVS